jgi:hypothetical protein
MMPVRFDTLWTLAVWGFAGGMITRIAASWLVYRLTGSATLLGMLAVVALVMGVGIFRLKPDRLAEIGHLKGRQGAMRAASAAWRGAVQQMPHYLPTCRGRHDEVRFSPILRRQAKDPVRRPLVLMQPKSMLRLPAAERKESWGGTRLLAIPILLTAGLLTVVAVDDHYASGLTRAALVAGCLSSTPEKAKASAPDYDIAAERAYTSIGELVQKEKALPADKLVEIFRGDGHLFALSGGKVYVQ